MSTTRSRRRVLPCRHGGISLPIAAPASCSDWPTCSTPRPIGPRSCGRSRRVCRSRSSTPGGTRPDGCATTRGGSTRSKVGSSPRSPADGLDYTLREPYGVVGVIPPWNGSMMGMGQKAAPALAAGNTVVAKPPELAPFGALAVRRTRTRGRDAARRAERRGRRSRGRRSPRAPHDVAKVSFTGGGPTATAVMQAARRDAHAARPRTRRQVGEHRLPRRRPRSRHPDVGVRVLVLLAGRDARSRPGCSSIDDVYDEVVERLVAMVESRRWATRSIRQASWVRSSPRRVPTASSA